MEKKRITSIDINRGSYDEFLDKIIYLGQIKASMYVCMANVHMAVEAYRDKTFAEVVNCADIVAPDGMPLAIAFKLIYGLNQERVAGMDIIGDLIRKTEKERLPIYLYGSTEEVLKKISERIAKEHPNLKIAGSFSPPFSPMSEKEEREVIDGINSSGAHVVLVALGCPKQETWMARKKGEINAVMVGLGGAFQVYARMQGRAPIWMQKLSLEWFYRLIKEPRRLFKRYFFTNSLFLWILGKEIFRQAFIQNKGK